MKKRCVWLCACLWATLGAASTVYNDTIGDLDPSLTSDGTVDIVSLEVSHTATDLIFDLTVNGDFTGNDWGKFMIGMATGGAGTTSGNGWNRPIHLDSPIGGMNYWIGAWVDGGGGAQLWNYNGATWDGPSALAAYSFTPGAQSRVTFTVARTNLGLAGGDTFYFDVYSSGAGATDSALDALSNPNVSITAWDQTYTSDTGTGISSYTLVDATADVSPANGPFAGGNTVVVTNVVPAIGDGSDVTNVLVGGVAATSILGQGTNWVSFVAPVTGSAGAKAVVIQSTSVGNTTLAGAYTVNPAGRIGGMVTDGFVWTNMAQGFNGDVYAIHAGTNGEIYAGGAFTSAVSGAESLQRIAKWDGTAWTNVGIGFNNSVREIGEDSTGTVYAVGNFDATFGANANCRRIGRWTGTAWTNMGVGVNSAGYMVAFDTNDVPYFGGAFTGDGYNCNFGRVAKWNGSGWTNIYGSTLTNGIGFNHDVYTSVRGADGTLYFGGAFTNAVTPTGSVAMASVAMWDGAELRPMGAGLNGLVYKLVVDSNGTLYAGGSFTASGGQNMNHVAKWTGTAWTNVGGGINSTVYVLAFDANGNLYAGGSFSSPGRNLAMWDGSTWSGAAADSINGAVRSLALHSNETMVAGGQFTSAGGVATNRIGLVRPNRYYSAGVTPSSGSWAGNYAVAIVGENIGNGDITNVTLCGVAATIRSQVVNRVWVTAGIAATAGTGDVVVVSTSYGTTVGTNSFIYQHPVGSVLGTNGAAIGSGDLPALGNGTAFAPAAFGSARTNTFCITNRGDYVLTITGVSTSGLGSAMFDLSGVPSTVAIGGASNFTVRYHPSAVGSHAASVVFESDDIQSPFIFNVSGSCFIASTNVGPFGGGNAVTFTNGNFGTITNVLVGGVAATIVDAGASWFTVVMPAVGAAGSVDVLVQTSDNGEITLPEAYTYNAAGEITSVLPATGSWTGGVEVVIGGTNLGNGSDITNVTICGVAVDAITGQSATQVVVTAGTAPAGLGDVVVVSTSHGATTAADAFEYLREAQAALGFAPASPQAENTTNALSVTGGSGTGVVSFAVTDGPGLIAGDTNLVATAGTGTITVVATKAQDDLYFAASVTATVTAAYAADVYLLDLRHIYDGTAKAASATTMPAGLTVQITYDGSATAPSAVGDYAVVGTVNDGEYYATATGTFRILAPWDYQHVNMGDGWCWVEWFGFYAPMGDWTWQGERGYGWLWHEKHGFFYVPDGQLQDEAWLYAMDMDWLWTGEGTYPYLYRRDDATWLWYSGDVNPRTFYNFTKEDWEERP